MSLDHTIMIPLFLSLLSPYYHYPIIRPSKNPLSLSQKGAPLQKGKRRHPTAAHANLAVWKIKRWQAGKWAIFNSHVSHNQMVCRRFFSSKPSLTGECSMIFPSQSSTVFLRGSPWLGRRSDQLPDVGPIPDVQTARTASFFGGSMAGCWLNDGWMVGFNDWLVVKKTSWKMMEFVNGKDDIPYSEFRGQISTLVGWIHLFACEIDSSSCWSCKYPCLLVKAPFFWFQYVFFHGYWIVIHSWWWPVLFVFNPHIHLDSRFINKLLDSRHVFRCVATNSLLKSSEISITHRIHVCYIW